MMRQRTFRHASLLLLSSLTALALLSSLSSCTLELDYDKYAIVYGISDYVVSKDLENTDDDARDFADLLNAQGYQVILRVTDDSTVDPLVLPNIDEASYDQLARDFTYIAQIADLDDLFLFYFSGHGGQDFASSGTTENSYGSDRFDEILALVNDDLSAEIYLSDDQLAVLLRTIPCARKVVIIDACNSGGFIGNSLEADVIPPDFSDGSDSLIEALGNAIYLYNNFDGYGSDISPADALVIAAAGERESSYDEFNDNGLMTYFLLESATKGDRNRDGYITVSESYNYIYRKINQNWNYTLYSVFNDVLFPRVSGGPIDYILFTK